MTLPLEGVVTPDGQDMRFDPYQEAVRRRTLKELAGQQVHVTIAPYRLTRSQKANRYLWGVVHAMLAKEAGMTPEDFHDAMCAKFLSNEAKRVEFFNKMTGECLTVDVDTRRSSKLKGGPFYDFVEEVRLWGVEFLGVITPDPDPEFWRHRDAKKRRAA